MKATKKLVGAAVALVAATSLTVGSTFAWFTSRSSVDIDSVSFNVTSDSKNLMVAVLGATESVSDSTRFAFTLDQTAITDKINSGTSIVYKDVTSADGIAIMKKDGSTAADAGSYAEFKLVFRYYGDDPTSLVLGSTSEISSTTADASYTPLLPAYAWDNFAANTYNASSIAKDDLLKARAANAARVSFQVGTDTSAKIWAPNEELADGMTNGTDTNDSPKGFYHGNLASDYNNHEYGEAAVTSVSLTGKRVYSAKDDTTTVANNVIKAFPAKTGNDKYSELTVTVRVWLEGTDGDCLNSVLSDEFAFKLAFRTGSAS